MNKSLRNRITDDIKAVREIINQSGLSYAQLSAVSGISVFNLICLNDGLPETVSLRRRKLCNAFFIYSAAYEEMCHRFDYLYDKYEKEE